MHQEVDIDQVVVMSLQLQNLDFYKDLKSLRLFDVWLDTPANNDLLDASSTQVCML